MEKIKRALERARLERESGAQAEESALATRVSSAPDDRSRGSDSSDQTAAAVDELSVDPESQAAGTRSPAPPAPPAPDDNSPELKVEYSITRQFKPKRRTLARNLVIGAGATPEVYSAYKILRTQVMQRLRENGWNTLAITSPSRGAGKTLTSLNLAISIAQELTYSVLLVELDLANPSIHQLLGLESSMGVVDHLLRDVQVSEILCNPGIDRLTVIPAGEAVEHTSELISSPKMARLVTDLKRRYDRRIVVFDLPAVLSADDAMAFSPFVECALLVVDEGETRIEEVKKAMEYLRATTVLGAVMNRSSVTEWEPMGRDR